jgi:hypothetical protein
MSTPVFLALTVPGFLVTYWLFIRPVLKAMPAFKSFYDTAEGFWQKVWAVCGNSAVLAFHYFIQVLSWCLQWIDPIATFFGDPDLRAQLEVTLKADPKILGYVLMAISAITIAARVRTLLPKDDD